MSTAPEQVRAEPWFSPVRPRRARTIAVQLIVWLALLSGPAALFAQLNQGGPGETSTEPERPADHGPTAVAVAGWAERAVAAYAEGDLDTVRVLYPTVTDRQLDDLPAAPSAPARVGTVAVERLGEQRWQATVAFYPPREDPAATAVRYLTLTAHGQGTTWAALDLPAEAGTWTAGELPAPPYAPGRLADSPLTEAVAGWAAAHLTGQGELDRYLAPDTAHPPVAPYARVEVTAVHAAEQDQERAAAPPGEGATVAVRADLVATDSDGRTWPMSYALELTSRGQRWEVSALTHPPLT
ncbi:hypothetical protein [Nocardiopsis sp. LOL_012]|uniref:hypothetical protein n=1 Tax=Nocardiopsis sp. LOL_012 TaxID=3345409 RepID=UPI003A857485